MFRKGQKCPPSCAMVPPSISIHIPAGSAGLRKGPTVGHHPNLWICVGQPHKSRGPKLCAQVSSDFQGSTARRFAARKPEARNLFLPRKASFHPLTHPTTPQCYFWTDPREKPSKISIRRVLLRCEAESNENRHNFYSARSQDSPCYESPLFPVLLYCYNAS